MMSSYFRRRGERRVIRHIANTMGKTEVEPTQGLFNYMCFFNAVEYASNNDGCEVVECIMVENERPSLHYVCMKDDRFLEVSLGHRANNIDYFMTRTITQEEWEKIDDIFEAALAHWNNTFTTWWERLIFRVDRVV